MSNAQDAHFSQFFASPLILNPALAGTAGSAYRLNLNYRDQWRSALDNPLRTFNLAGDIRYEVGQQKTYSDMVGAGFMFYSDQVGDFDLNTNQIALVGAYHKSLSKHYPQYLGIGLQFGLYQKSINYEDLTFADQFNAIDGYTNATGELLPANNFAVVDFATGLSYMVEPTKDLSYSLGISYAHFTSPNVSFYKSDQTPNPTLVRKNALNAKLTGFAALSFRTAETLEIQPRVLYLKQGNHSEANIGTNFRYKFIEQQGRYFHIGPWLRMVNNEDGFGVESIILAVGVEFGSFTLGLSYDHNISDLITDRSGLNAFEISFAYRGEIDDYDTFCPRF